MTGPNIDKMLVEVKNMAPQNAREYLIGIIKSAKDYDWVEAMERRFGEFRERIPDPTVAKQIWDALETHAMDLYFKIGGLKLGKPSMVSPNNLSEDYDIIRRSKENIKNLQIPSIDDLVEAPVDLSKGCKNFNTSNGQSIFITRSEIHERYRPDKKKKTKSDIIPEVVRDEKRIREYLNRCSEEYKKFIEKSGRQFTDNILLSNPPYLFCITEDILGMDMSPEKFKDEKYRKKVYDDYILVYGLLKRTREQVEGLVKGTAEYLLDRLKSSAKSIMDYVQTDRKNHPEWFYSEKNNGGAK